VEAKTHTKYYFIPNHFHYTVNKVSFNAICNKIHEQIIALIALLTTYVYKREKMHIVRHLTAYISDRHNVMYHAG
jgi:hypothetical protein